MSTHVPLAETVFPMHVCVNNAAVIIKITHGHKSIRHWSQILVIPCYARVITAVADVSEILGDPEKRLG